MLDLLLKHPALIPRLDTSSKLTPIAAWCLIDLPQRFWNCSLDSCTSAVAVFTRVPFCSSPEEFDYVKLAMELRKKRSDMSATADDLFYQASLLLEVRLLGEKVAHDSMSHPLCDLCFACTHAAWFLSLSISPSPVELRAFPAADVSESTISCIMRCIFTFDN